jgi:hypothetical protein
MHQESCFKDTARELVSWPHWLAPCPFAHCSSGSGQPSKCTLLLQFVLSSQTVYLRNTTSKWDTFQRSESRPRGGSAAVARLWSWASKRGSPSSVSGQRHQGNDNAGGRWEGGELARTQIKRRRHSSRGDREGSQAQERARPLESQGGLEEP